MGGWGAGGMEREGIRDTGAMKDEADSFGECKLCGQKTELCKSHIVPEFCYTRLYDRDPKGRSAVAAMFTAAGPTRVRKIQKGLREYMLCASCENRINTRYEQPFSKYWYGPSGLPSKMDLGYMGFWRPGTDYTSTKLLHWSILWRAAMARRFSGISLGPYGDKIAKMLLSGDPGPPQSFPVFGQVLVNEQGVVNHALVTAPIKARCRHSYAYIMCYAGCEWYFVLTEHPDPADAKKILEIAAAGNMCLVYCPWLESRTAKTIERLGRRR